MTPKEILLLRFIVILATFRFVELNNIFFQKYCINGTNPPAVPSNGDGSSGFLVMNEKTIASQDNIESLNCSVTLTSDFGYQLFVTFIDVGLLTKDSLSVLYNDQKQHATLVGHYKCPNESCHNLQFQSGRTFQNVTFQFVSKNVTNSSMQSSFKAVYTVFDIADSKTGRCKDSKRFLCLNGHCISSELVCNGHNNCGDRSDENQCTVPIYDTVWGIAVIVLAVVSTLTFVPLFCFLAIRGTQKVVKSVTVPHGATPLYSAVSDDEMANLLASSGALPSDYWSSTERERSISGSYRPHRPSVSNSVQPHSSYQNFGPEFKEMDP